MVLRMSSDVASGVAGSDVEWGYPRGLQVLKASDISSEVAFGLLEPSCLVVFLSME